MIEKNALRKILERLKRKDGAVVPGPTPEELATICEALTCSSSSMR